MDSLQGPIRGWLGEARALEAALRVRLADMGAGEGSPDHSIQDTRFLAFQLAVRLGQARDATVALAALGGQDSAGYGVSAGARLWERQIRSEVANLAREEFLSQAASLRVQEFAGFDDLFSIACDLRRLAAAAAVIANVSRDVLPAIGDRLQRATASLSAEDQLYFRDSVRNLLSDYWLYPGIHGVAKDDGGSRYSDLFALAATTLQGDGMQGIGGLERALDEMDLDGRIRSAISEALGRIEEMTRQDGSSVFDSSSGDGPYVTGGSPDIMVIPGTGGGSCRPILLAIAGSRGRGARSPKKVIQRMQEVLVECAPKVQIAVFLSDAAGMGAVLEDNLGLVEAHIRRGHLKGFLPVVVVGHRLTVINWRG